MDGNPKERAIALLAGLGFAFSQFATNTDYRDYNIGVIRRTLEGAAGVETWLAIGMGALTMVSPLLFCAFGMRMAYGALCSAGVPGQEELFEMEIRSAMRQAIGAVCIVVLAVGVNVVTTATKQPATPAPLVAPTP